MPYPFPTGTNLGDQNSPIEHFLCNMSGEWTLSRCATASIPSGIAQYAIGGIIEASDTGIIYSNKGTAASCVFSPVQSVTGSEINIGTASAINATATATAAAILGGVITSTSAAATAITTPTATAIAALIPGVTRGTALQFFIDNSAGASTVTLILDASITAPAGAITGGNSLTVTTTNKVGMFELYFTSTTTAVIYRLA